MKTNSLGIVLLSVILVGAAVRASAAGGLSTQSNGSLLFPARDLFTTGVPGLTNAVSGLTLSALAPDTAQGGRVTIINTQAWVSFYRGPSHYDQPSAMIVDRSNQVCITGSSLRQGTAFDFVTIQYSRDGGARWTNHYDGSAHGDDYGRHLATDGSGNVYVAGDSARSGSAVDVVSIKYSADGAPLWTNNFNLTGTNYNFPSGLAVDAAGNVYVLISTVYADPGYITLKYNTLGQPVWTNIYKGSSTGSGFPVSLAVDRSGDVFATGTSDEDTGLNFVTVKYGGDGSSLWTNRYTGSQGSVLESMALDRAGGIIVSGDAFSNPRVYATIRYSSDGTPSWTNLLAAPNYQGGNVPLVAADPAGNVFVTGGSPGASGVNADFVTVKIATNGLPLWTNRFFEINADNAAPGGTAIDNAGSFYFAGHSTGPGLTNSDFVIVKYAGDGTRLWTNRFNGPANGLDHPQAIVVDGAGDLYVTGITKDPFGVWNCVTLKYSDYILYTPPPDFEGTDTLTFTAVNEAGELAVGSINVTVSPPLVFDTSPANLLFTTAGFQMLVENVQGTNPVVIFASTNLTYWEPISTNLPVFGTITFFDSAATNHPRRFYRAGQSL